MRFALSPKSVVMISIATILASCAREHDSGGYADLKIDSGWFVGEGGAGDHTIPGVMWLGNCTATAVSDNTLVTAGHCVNHGADASGKLAQKICIKSGTMAKDKCSDALYVPSRWDNGELFRQDVAVAIFPRGTFTRYFEVNDKEISIGEQILLVGYSDHNNATPSKGSKRWGYNKVSSFEEETVIISEHGGTGANVAVSPGDSGGPLFDKQCKLTGVASRMSEQGSKISLHTNLADTDNNAWFKSLREKGAEFCGMAGAKAEFCKAEGRASPKQVSNAAGQPEFPCTETGAPASGATVADAFMALDANDALHVSLPATTDKVWICADKDLASCTADEHGTSFEKTIGERRIYKTKALATTLKKLVVIARDASGKELSRSSADLTAK